jgi:hypothetical protein
METTKSKRRIHPMDILLRTAIRNRLPRTMDTAKARRKASLPTNRPKSRFPNAKPFPISKMKVMAINDMRVSPTV